MNRRIKGVEREMERKEDRERNAAEQRK